jgi:tRNA pseudouridine55 synthase
MSRRRPEAPGAPGFLVVDKPRGWTSHDVVDAARRWLGTRRIGHLGTLDPLATGVLPLAVREATKLAPFLSTGAKTYTGEIELGVETDTLDAEGRVLRRHPGELPSEAALRAALPGFLGEILQVPPMFSAVKRGGVPLHRLARAGRRFPRAQEGPHRSAHAARPPPRARIEVRCPPAPMCAAWQLMLGNTRLRRLPRRCAGPPAGPSGSRTPRRWRCWRRRRARAGWRRG